MPVRSVLCGRITLTGSSPEMLSKNNLKFSCAAASGCRYFYTKQQIERIKAESSQKNSSISKIFNRRDADDKKSDAELLSQLRKILKSEKSAAKTAFNHGAMLGASLQTEPAGGKGFGATLGKLVEGGNQMVFIFRKIVILTFAGCGFWLSYKLYTWQDSDKNSWLSAAANGSLDPAAKSTGNMRGRLKGAKGSEDFKPVRFADIVGCDEAKEELQDIVFYLKKPRQLAALGGKVPKGVLLMGPPGVGKTMMARAVATEAGVPFYYRSGSSFDEIFVGVGASRMKELFATARKTAPCVIFVDEIDAVGGDRNSQGSSRQTINQFLAEMDGFKENNGIIVIGATNLGKVLDPALTRAGRFDNKIVLSLPDADGRIKLVQHYIKRVKTDGKLDVTKAALKAANDGDSTVEMKHLDWARMKTELGREKNKKGDPEDMEELRNTAYHEAAHTLVAHHLKIPYYGVTIERRSNTLGHMRHDISEDFPTRKFIAGRIAVALAGKLGEDALVGEGKLKHTTGCSSDYQVARATATKYVTKYGFGERFYPCAENGPISDKYQVMIEKEVKEILDTAEKEAKKIMKEHSEKHLKLSEKLLEKYKLTADEVKEILA